MFVKKLLKGFDLNDNRQYIAFILLPLLVFWYSALKNPYIPMYASSIAEDGWDLVIENHKQYGAIVDNYQRRSEPTIPLTGRYSAKDIVNGNEVTLTFIFGDNNSLKKRVKYKNGYVEGEATYHFHGETLEFTNITGQPRLFPSAGEAIVVNDLDSVTLPAFNYLRLKRE